jgi:hypothetical protein
MDKNGLWIIRLNGTADDFAGLMGKVFLTLVTKFQTPDKKRQKTRKTSCAARNFSLKQRMKGMAIPSPLKRLF